MMLVILTGILDLSSASRSAWRAMRLDEASYDDWPDEAPMFDGESGGAHETVGDVLDALAALTAADSDYFVHDARTNEISAVLSPDNAAALHQDLATALRLAGTIGARGRLAFTIPEESVGLVVTIGEEAPHWAPLQELFGEDEHIARGFVDGVQYVTARNQDPSLGFSAYVEKRRSLGLLPLEQQPHHRELVLELLRVAPERVFAAIAARQILDSREQLLSVRYTTASDLRRALEAYEPEARAAAIELFGHVDAPRVEGFALRLVEDPSGTTRAHAYRALGRVASDTAFQALLDARARDGGDPLLTTSLQSALAESPAPRAEAAIASLLEGEPFAAASWEKLHRVDDAAARARLAGLAQLDLQTFARRLGQKAVAPLFALFDEHPAEEIRKGAAQQLAVLGGPVAEQRAAEINCTLMGMGRALNRDDRRRREILGLGEPDDAGGLERLVDIDLETLTALLRERFADPTTTQNMSPPIGTFHEILTAHPELRVGGYLIGLTRPDARVSIDSITCHDIEAIPAERRDEVTAMFESLSESATNCDPDGASFRCWWT